MRLAILLLGLAYFGIAAVWHEEPGPAVIATKGEMFPQARIKKLNDWYLIVRPKKFHFAITGETCDIIRDATGRYFRIISKEGQIAWETPFAEILRRRKVDGRKTLTHLEINLKNPCERRPYLHMNENYTLEINKTTGIGILSASEIWGILRGLESFSQLLTPSADGYLSIDSQKIVDFPRFPHRGLLLDTTRHYIPVEDIMLTLDAMSYNKLNVFHWHITGDNSFPYVSTAFPELSAKGAYHPSMVYTPKNVTAIVEYARLRGIRVITEFNTPAHTKFLVPSHPKLLTECWEGGKLSGRLGPMNPTKPEVWTFLKTLFDELFQVFPDRHFHLGGDEMLFDCWANNPDIIRYMKEHDIPDVKGLKAEWSRKLLELTKAANVTPIVLQDVFTNVQDLSRDVIVQIYTGAWRDLMIDVLNKNHSLITSAGWHLRNGDDWTKLYTVEPLSFEGTPEAKSRVLGGAACMWTEDVDKYNVHSRIWPLASAVAERLWSNPTFDINEAARRLEEHACRMIRRGIDAQPPNGPGFCVM